LKIFSGRGADSGSKKKPGNEKSHDTILINGCEELSLPLQESYEKKKMYVLTKL
jgi:hypothetical protein